MDCEELLRLRAEAQQWRKELEDRLAKAREGRTRPRPGRPNHTDYEGFLRRKIARASAAIESHVSQHRCQ